MGDEGFHAEPAERGAAISGVDGRPELEDGAVGRAGNRKPAGFSIHFEQHDMPGIDFDQGAQEGLVETGLFEGFEALAVIGHRIDEFHQLAVDVADIGVRGGARSHLRFGHGSNPRSGTDHKGGLAKKR